MIETPIKPSL